MIQTEKATSRWDLPHTAELAATLTCTCGRPAEHALHHPVSLEKASESITIVTEKGI